MKLFVILCYWGSCISFAIAGHYAAALLHEFVQQRRKKRK